MAIKRGDLVELNGKRGLVASVHKGAATLLRVRSYLELAHRSDVHIEAMGFFVRVTAKAIVPVSKLRKIGFLGGGEVAQVFRAIRAEADLSTAEDAIVTHRIASMSDYVGVSL